MAFTCPICGEDVPDKAKSCPHCGSDENTGWSEKTYLDGVDLGDEFDYEETLKKEGLLQKSMDWKSMVFLLLVGGMILLFLLRFVLQLF